MAKLWYYLKPEDRTKIMRLRDYLERKEERNMSETEAQKELSDIQTAVHAMMVDNQLSRLPNPVTVATNDMTAFPDLTSVAGSADKLRDPKGFAYEVTTDKNGYIMFGHDITGSASVDPNPDQAEVNYVATGSTSLLYIVDASGTVTQVTAGED